MRLMKHMCLVVVLFLSSCGGDSGDQTSKTGSPTSDESPTYGGTVVRHLETDCKTLNWVLYTTVYENYVIRYLNDNLLDYDENMDIIPVLAEKYEISDNNLRITVTLKEGLQWHDGEPITTEDVDFTIKKILDKAVPAVNKEAWFSKLDGTEIVDERTIVFVWKELYAPALHALTQLAPIPKHIYSQGDFLTNPANRKPVGSGAFVFEEWRTGQSITLVRNENYHGPKPYLDRVVFKVIPDRSVALNALKAGELDEMRVRQPQWEQQLKDKNFQRDFNGAYYYVPQYNYLSWNCRSVWFKDPRVRQAMSMLFDRETINSELYSGYAQLVSGPFYVNSWAYDKNVKPMPFDPAEAKRLLTDAGWVDSDSDGIREKDGINFEFDIYLRAGGRIALEFAQLLQEQCGKAGVTVKIQQLEGTTFFDRVFKGEYDSAILAWRLDIDPDIFDTFHSSQVPPIGLNHTFYTNAKVDELLEAGRTEFDPEKRKKIYHEVHRAIHDDSPYTFINAVPEKRPIRKTIGNVVLSPDGPFNFYPGAIYWYVKSEMVEARN